MERSNDSGSNMKWTKDKPTVPGWYWKKETSTWSIGSEIQIVHVRKYRDKMCILNWEIPDNVEWAGPISKPEE